MADFKTISDKTLVPLSVVIAIVSATMWASSVKAEAEESRIALAKSEKLMENYSNILRNIDERLSKIEGAVESYRARNRR